MNRPALINLLWDSLKRDSEHKDRRKTGDGTKTQQGLLATIERYANEPEPDSVQAAVEQALKASHLIYGRGAVVSIVWSMHNYAGVTAGRSGVVVSQQQYGMRANEFTVSEDWKTIRYLSHTRPVL